MDLLNSMIKAAASSLIKENPEFAGKAAALLCDLFAKTGGINGLMKKFQENGLENIINSWIGNGEKLPVSTEQLGQIIGKANIEQFASQVDLNRNIFEMLLAKGLPKVVHQLAQKGSMAAQESNALSLERAQELVKHFLS